MKRTTLVSLIGLVASLPALACGGYGSGMVAHEWGTFTSVQGADGVQVAWNPFAKTDLPGFVYDRTRPDSPAGDHIAYQFSKSATRTLIRMETPVIYFYSPTATTVDVRVDFPQGRITEWYPQATAIGPYPTTVAAEKARANKSFIEWKNVRVLPPNTTEATADKLIREPGENHYYAARETEANLLRMDARSAKKGPEYDRLLFYRGIGSFAAPLNVTMPGEDSLKLATSTGDKLSDLFVLTIRNGEARYQYLNEVSGAGQRTVTLSSAAFAPLSDVRKRLMAEMETALTRQGLYQPESRAMVNTWKDQWFAEEGTRVLYLLPGEWTDRMLPLNLSPKPQSVVRVMVGRSEMITPGAEHTLDRSIASYHNGNPLERRQAVQNVQALKLGRFLEPAVQRVLAGRNDKALANSAWKLASEANSAVQASNIGKSSAPVDSRAAAPVGKQVAAF